MNAFTLSLKLTLTSLVFLTILLNPALADPDSQADKKQHFRGVYYGALPCRQCPGITAILSLKNKNNYLLVTQKAKESTREFFEKGKYDWNEESGLVTLTPRKNSSIRKLRIKNDETLIMLSFDGIVMKNNPNKFTLTKREQQESGGMHNMH
jgi:hypothetical protein